MYILNLYSAAKVKKNIVYYIMRIILYAIFPNIIMYISNRQDYKLNL